MNINAKIIDATILIAAATILISVIVMPILYKMQAMEDMRSKTIIELIQKGVDPIAARCSIADAKDYLCLVYVTSKSGSSVK